MKATGNLLMILAGLTLSVFALVRAGGDFVLAVSEPVLVDQLEVEDLHLEASEGTFPGSGKEDRGLPLENTPRNIPGLSPSFTDGENESGMNPLIVPSDSKIGEQPATAPAMNELTPVKIDSLEPAKVAGEPPMGEIPRRLVIPAIGLDAPIVPVRAAAARFSGQDFLQWLAPNYFSAGWHESSALLGLPGNTVLNGHHNEHGEVFRNLVNLKEGDLIHVSSDNKQYTYIIANRLILAEKYEKPEVRLENARWILPSSDERITLLTCWPKHTNTHRLILVASPWPSD